MTVLELRSVADNQVLGTIGHEHGLLTFDGAAQSVFAELRAILGNERLWTDLAASGWSNGYLYIAVQGAPPPAPVVASGRFLWDGCRHGFHDAHDGPCP